MLFSLLVETLIQILFSRYGNETLESFIPLIGIVRELLHHKVGFANIDLNPLSL